MKNLYKKFKKGDIVTLDKGYTNESKVTVISQTSNMMFTLVEDNGVQWEVMTNRLT